MVGWKRIVITLGKNWEGHLTYAQGAVAEITAMATIGRRRLWTPGQHHARPFLRIAGTMAANHSGIQWSTVRNLVMAWFSLCRGNVPVRILVLLFRKTSEESYLPRSEPACHLAGRIEL